MKALFVLLLTVVLSIGVFAQDVTIDDIDEFMEKQEEKKRTSVVNMNVLYFELLGNGGIITANYERFIQKNMSIRVGAGSALLVAGTFPVMFNYFVGEDHKLELGIGATICTGVMRFRSSGDTYNDETFVVGTATVGYRYQPVNGGSVFRIGLTPFFIDDGAFPWAGIGFGFSF